MLIRLNKLLAQRGVASRREADRLIEEGSVEVNGVVVQELGTKVDDAADGITVKGRKIKPGRELVYMALHKPPGYLVTLRDPLGRPTIKTLIPTLPDGVCPVGRLDRESEGLLLLTNDGELAFRLTHPRYEVPKIYLVRVEGGVPAETIAKLEAGVLVEGKKTAPAKVKALETREAFTVLQVEIHEGRKREIRLMFSSVGHEVLRLERTSFGGIKLERLEPGRWRFLKAAEVGRLRKLVGLENATD
jgi:pseudouridine synthase